MQQPNVENLWQLAMECSPVGFALVTAEGVVLSVNRAMWEMVGCTEEEFCARGFVGVSHPDDAAIGFDLADDGDAVSHHRFVKRYLHTDGSTVWGDVSVTLLRAADGSPVHHVTQVVDVTAERMHEARAARATDHVEHEQRVAQAILDTADVGLVLIDREGRYQRMNRRHADFMALAFPDGHHGRGGQAGEVYAADGTTLVDPADMPTSRSMRGEDFDDHRIWVGADPAARRALSVSGRSVLTPEGVFDGATLAYNDVTDLMNAMRAREDFVAMVSHELRSPLAAVLAHLELVISEDHQLDADVHHSLAAMHRNVLRLRHLVADLLESANQRNGRLSLVKTWCDVAAVVRDVVEAATAAAVTGGVELGVDLGADADGTPGRLPAFVDEQRVRQVVDNLVSNAVKYTRAGGRVDITLTTDGSELELSVADTGVGIEAGDADRVFLPFIRADRARDMRAPGIGLGLAIVSNIVEAHHGVIEMTSSPGVGSTFRVRLPTARDAEAPAPDEASADDADDAPLAASAL